MRREKTLSTGTLAAALGISPATLRVLERAGEIPKVRRDPRNRRQYTSRDLEAVLQRCRQRGILRTIAEVRANILRLESDTDVLVAKQADICGGDARIVGTRVPIWAIIKYVQLGLSDEGIVENFPTLTKYDLEIARKYYKGHRAEIDQQIKMQDNGD